MMETAFVVTASDCDGSVVSGLFRTLEAAEQHIEKKGEILNKYNIAYENGFPTWFYKIDPKIKYMGFENYTVKETIIEG